jgi:hypothetical protein
VTRLQFIVTPFGTEGAIEGIFEILLELVVPIAVGSHSAGMKRSAETSDDDF